MVILRETLCKSVLSPCRIIDIPYSVNPYVGCEHACVYCYARFMLRYRPHQEAWGEFVDIKTNAPEVLAEQLKQSKQKLVLLSSVTDPYQPIEAKLSLTRRCIQKLLENQFPLTILTKSSLVIRDIDLFKRFSSLEVGFSIVTLDDEIRKNFEPAASPIEERLQALTTLVDAGIPTYTFIGPILPIISETSLGNLVQKLADIGVKKILVDRLNIKAGNWKAILNVLNSHYKSLLPDFQRSLFIDREYYSKLKHELSETLKKLSIDYSFCY